jgi:hypothetical protein
MTARVIHPTGPLGGWVGRVQARRSASLGERLPQDPPLAFGERGDPLTQAVHADESQLAEKAIREGGTIDTPDEDTDYFLQAFRAGHTYPSEGARKSE